jgi:hypothetical protein
VQQKTNRLMSVVSEAVHAQIPKAKPSPYAKRWWTTDLTQLRQIYTYWRNHARAERRAGRIRTELEEMAKGAAKQYHSAIRQQKNKHWDEFLADNDNIWEAAKYLKSGNDTCSGLMGQLRRTTGNKLKSCCPHSSLPCRMTSRTKALGRRGLPWRSPTLEEVE